MIRTGFRVCGLTVGIVVGRSRAEDHEAGPCRRVRRRLLRRRGGRAVESKDQDGATCVSSPRKKSSRYSSGSASAEDAEALRCFSDE